MKVNLICPTTVGSLALCGCKSSSPHRISYICIGEMNSKEDFGRPIKHFDFDPYMQSSGQISMEKNRMKVNFNGSKDIRRRVLTPHTSVSFW